MAKPQAPLRPSLTYSQAVPRHLVHRSAIAEVFPTDSAIDGDDILVACQLPVGHHLYNDRVQPFVDPLLVLEAGRQAALLCCLRHLGAAHDATFVVRSAGLRVLRPLTQGPGASPWNVHFRCTPHDPQTADGVLTGGRIDLTLQADGHERASITFRFAALTPELYSSLRDPGLRRVRKFVPAETTPFPRPFEPSRLGRVYRDNVVIAEPVEGSKSDLPVVVRTDHPGFFDHPLDHVSAAVMVEACRQAAHAACPTVANDCDLAAFDAHFSSFAELGLPLFARVGDCPPCDTAEQTVTVELLQLDSVIATVDVTLRAIDGRS